MKIGKVRWVVYFLLMLGSSGEAFAQNILNDTVFVSMSSITEIGFNSPIDKTVMPNGDGSYETNVSGNAKSILITASKKNAKSQPLIVNEGTREHKFILSFKDGVPPARIDWSNLKKLSEHIARNQQLPVTPSNPATRAQLPNNTPVNSDSVKKSKGDHAGEVAEPAKANKTFSEATALFQKGLWQEAKTKYSQVRDPDLSEFIRFRLEEINKKLEEEKKLAEPPDQGDRIMDEKKFEDYVNSGAEALKNRDVPAAKKAYNEALKLKPGDSMVTGLLVNVDKMEKPPVKNVALQKTDSLKRAEYDKAVFIADRFYDAKDYNFAREEYKRAARIFPDSIYPGNQLKKITQALTDSSTGKSYQGRKQ